MHKYYLIACPGKSVVRKTDRARHDPNGLTGPKISTQINKLINVSVSRELFVR